mmetsp:Transcript_62252/g.96761  ORF Transcript_62252/g.96761 Transcript_62252/m.96761 type:complete len:137 (-) Transcript_62252:148-558(-)
MSSGVKVADACKEKFDAMKKNKDTNYVIFKIEDKKEIVIEKEGDKEKTYDEFLADLPENEPRYAVLDFKTETTDGRPLEKLCFFVWSPDDKCGVKDKMLYASSKDALKKKLDLQKEHQANDNDDAKWEEVLATLRK